MLHLGLILFLFLRNSWEIAERRRCELVGGCGGVGGVGLEHRGTVRPHEVFRSLIQLFFSPVYSCPACLSKTLINLPAQQLTSVNILRLQLASANWAFRSSRIYNSVQLCRIPKGRSVYLSAHFHFFSFPVLIAASYVNRAGEDLI